MAENEYLDLRKSQRWQRVLREVVDGKSAEEIAPLAGFCLIQTLNRLHEPVFEGGPPQVPFADLFDAVGDPRETERIERRYPGHDFIRLFRNSTIDAPSLVVAVENFLSAICEKYFDQIVVHAVKPDGKHTFAQVRSRVDEVRVRLEPEKRRIAQQLVADPNRKLRQPRLTDAIKATVNTQSVLRESLLEIKR